LELQKTQRKLIYCKIGSTYQSYCWQQSFLMLLAVYNCLFLSTLEVLYVLLLPPHIVNRLVGNVYKVVSVK